MRFDRGRSDFHEDFLRGVKILLDPMGRGCQASLARASGISQSYLCDILKKRRVGTEQVRRAISRALDRSYEEVIQIGGNMGLRKSNIELYNKCRIFPMYSEKRAACVYQFAAEKAGIRDSDFFDESALVEIRPRGWAAYLNGGMSDEDLLRTAEEEIERFVEINRMGLFRLE